MVLSERRDDFLACAFLALATYAAHFLLSSHFGLYEDDYLYFAAPMTAPGWSPIYHHVIQNFRNGIQGRPLGESIPTLVSYLGTQIGGLKLIYFMGYTVIAVNVCLAYLVIKRVAPRPAAVVGALVFCLYPADTSKILLTHSLILQCAWTCTLGAALAWVSGRTRVYFLLAFLPLVIYESMILPLFVIPLLRLEFSRTFFRRYADSFTT